MRAHEIVPLYEGINDPAIFKVIFVVGGPGSGKSFIVNKLGLKSLGFVSVNSDTALEHLMQKHDLDMKMPPEEEEERDIIRARAKEITANKLSHAIDGRLGIIIDGTGEDYTKIVNLRENFESLGYSAYLIIVNTRLEISLMRNSKRERSVPDKIVQTKWLGVQNNIGKFMNDFDHATVIDNNGDSIETMPQIEKTYKRLKHWLAKKPHGPMVDEWIKQERAKREVDREVDKL